LAPYQMSDSTGGEAALKIPAMICPHQEIMAQFGNTENIILV
jgi:hypothetical protein